MSREPLEVTWPRRVWVGVFAVATVTLVASHAVRIFTPEFDVRPLLVAVAASGTLALLVSAAPGGVRLIVIAVSAIGGAAVAITRVGGSLPDDLTRAPMHGISDLVAAVWPSPPIAAGVGALALAACLCAGLAVDLAIHRLPVVALLPSLALAGLIAALSAGAGPPGAWAVSAYVLAALGVLGARTFAYRSSVTAISGAVVVVIAMVVPLLLGGQLHADRYDPRTAVVPADQPVGGISPLARLDEWRSRTPPEPVFTSSYPTPARWRLVGLTRYDGRTWLPAADYRQAGSVVTTADADLTTEAIDVTIEQLDADWLPMLDRTTSVSTGVRVDETRSALLADTTPTRGQTYRLQVQPLDVQPAQLSNARAVPTASSPFVDGFAIPPQMAQLASSITAGARTDYERAEAIATYLRNEFILDVDSPPGHSIAVLDLFVDQSRRGRDEQFVATFGLLAASVGLPVRIAVGFDTVLSQDAGPLAATVAGSDHVQAWPEVQFEGFGWVPFDPVPAAANTGSPSTGDGAVAPTDDNTDKKPPTTAATTTQTTLPDDSSNDIVLPAEPGALSGTAVAIAIVVIGAMWGLVAYVAIIVWLKARRRQRRRRLADPRDRAVAAFISSVEVMIDLGARAPRSATNAEVVHGSDVVIGETARMLDPVAALATEAVYSPVTVSTERADDAWSTADRFGIEAQQQLGLISRWRSRASARSLRRRWR